MSLSLLTSVELMLSNTLCVHFGLGNTERRILENIVDIVGQSLPLNKVIGYCKDVKGALRDVVLGYVTFTSEGKNVSQFYCQVHILIVVNVDNLELI